MRIDRDPLPGDPAEHDRRSQRLAQPGDRQRPDHVASAPDPEDERTLGCADDRYEVAGLVGDCYAGTGSPASQIARISAAARTNSSSAITGVPSKGSSRSISTHERQPWYSSRTRTVTGRGIR